MDAISYSYADKQAKRIKKFINDPDSTSGIVTVPKVIASGENITVPAGRVAVLPNVQIDGTLNVQGDVFIPSGATLSGVVEKVTSTDNAIVRFDGTTGKVQNSGVVIDDNNSVTTTGYIKSVYSQIAGNGFTGTYATDDSGIYTDVGNTNYRIYTGGSERMRIDSAGNVGIGTTPSAWTTGSKAVQIGTTSALWSLNNSGTQLSNNYLYNAGWNQYLTNGYATTYVQNVSGQHVWYTAPSGIAGNTIPFNPAMTLDANGNLLVGVTSDTSTPNNGVSIRNTNGTVGNIGIGHASGTVSGNAYQIFAYAGTQIGSIYQAGTTAVVFSTTSDYRLKENIRPADCKRFMDIKFVDYERIDGRHECGVIAHELQEIYPDLVTGEKDATEIRKVEISPAVEEVKDEDGNIITEAVEAVYEEQEFPVYQQVNYMGLIARIGTVVQQQAKLIEAMRAEIDELKGIGGAK